MSLRKIFCAAVASAVACVALPSEAALSVEIEVTGSAPDTATASLADLNNDGIIVFGGSVGGVELALNLSSSNRNSQSPSSQAQLINDITASNLLGGPVSVKITTIEDDFLHPNGYAVDFLLQSFASRGSAIGAVASLATYFNNVLVGSQTFTVGGGSPSLLASVPVGTPFQVKQVITFDLAAGPTIGNPVPDLATTGGSLRSQTNVTAVTPEPTSLALLGLGGLGLVGGAIRRRRASKTA